jgi:hypothetical protein
MVHALALTMNQVQRDGADYVIARQAIYELDGVLAVPRGTRGHVDDEADGYLYVDFGEPYGIVMCEPIDLD